MEDNHLQHRLSSYNRWKTSLSRTIEGYQVWLEEHGLGNADVDRRLHESLETLASDTMTIAFVAEFSRGKSELINAMFFSGHGQRLLPSDAGSTTKCPTELFYDESQDEPFLRLLPIETRSEDSSIRTLKKDPTRWTTLPLNPNDAEQMATTLNEVVRTKRMPLGEAQRLGFYPEIKVAATATLVEIPVWRHALINYPHPLLKQGLTILDTPGLNALGSEPELTLHSLASAQVILFVLSADTGVTRSDLEIWQEHIRPGRKGRGKSVAVAMNKIDTLWDELKDDQKVTETIERQHQDVSRVLEVDRDAIFPVSAQKALLARIRHDYPLLRDSRLETLERFISTEILKDRQVILRESLSHEIGDLINNSYNTVANRLKDDNKQLQQLQASGTKNTDVLRHLHQHIQEDRDLYLKALKCFKRYKTMLANDTQRLLRSLNLDELDQLIAESRKDLAGRWTTAGMSKSMHQCFSHIDNLMRHAHMDIEQLNALISLTYKQLHEEHPLPNLTPPLMQIEKAQRDFARLLEKAERYRKSPKTAITGQSVVVKQFFLTLVNSAREIMVLLRTNLREWAGYSLDPLGHELNEQHKKLSLRIETIKKLSNTRSAIKDQNTALNKTIELGEQQLRSLNKMNQLLNEPAPFEVISNPRGSAAAAKFA